jgi:hypothetical protein
MYVFFAPIRGTGTRYGYSRNSYAYNKYHIIQHLYVDYLHRVYKFYTAVSEYI